MSDLLFPNEEIKDIVGYEGFYKITSFGRVFNVARWVNSGIRGSVFIKGKFLAPIYNEAGYITTRLSVNGKVKSFRVHRLVAETFIPNPCNKPQINHKNGIKDDNRVENLEWCTRSENIYHAYREGLTCAKGEGNGQAKLTNEQVLEIRAMKGVLQKDIGEMFGINGSTVSEIRSRKLWKHI